MNFVSSIPDVNKEDIARRNFFINKNIIRSKL